MDLLLEKRFSQKTVFEKHKGVYGIRDSYTIGKNSDTSKSSTQQASKEISHHIWLVEARDKLRDRLGLAVGETDSSKIQAKAATYQPTFGSGDNLNTAQIDDFNKRLQPYCKSANPTGCGTFVGKISSNDVRYPFVHFRLTHDPISERDSSKKNKLTRISDEEYLKYPPVAAICIDYPDHRSSKELPSTEVLKAEYKQKTLETLSLYNELKVDHLVKHGDGMGVFLKQKRKQLN